MLRLFWRCLELDKPTQSFVGEALDELRVLLANPPVELRLQAHPLPDDLGTVLDRYLSSPPLEAKEPFRTCWMRFAEGRETGQWAPLLVCCRTDSKLAKAARAQSPNAVWGLFNELISAVYNLHNKYILWHEVFHLWGADDCYSKDNPNTGPHCGLPGCIMQYAPTPQTVCTWPFLCPKNVDRVRRWSENHAM
jgi:hypothetical protein